MSFLIEALDPAPFAPLFAMDAATLSARGARPVVAEASPGYPCRVSLADAAPGERLVLVNHAHLPDAGTPYRASHAVYVREGATRARPAQGEVPEMLRRRTLSLRGFDSDLLMCAAALVEGDEAAPALTDMLATEAVAFVHVHFAARGCYAATARRA